MAAGSIDEVYHSDFTALRIEREERHVGCAERLPALRGSPSHVTFVSDLCRRREEEINMLVIGVLARGSLYATLDTPPELR